MLFNVFVSIFIDKFINADDIDMIEIIINLLMENNIDYVAKFFINLDALIEK